MLAETYMQLLKDPAHWLFELTLVVIFDGLIGLLVWPRIRDHLHRDVRHAAGHPAADDPTHVRPVHDDEAPGALLRPGAWDRPGPHRRV